jgi:hypothetical protein
MLLGLLFEENKLPIHPVQVSSVISLYEEIPTEFK